MATPQPPAPSPRDPGSRPAVVWLLGLLLAAQVLCGGWVLGFSGLLGVLGPEATLPAVYVGWTALLALVTIRPLFLGRPWAWAAVLGLYLAAATGTLASVAFLAHRGLPAPPASLLRAALECTLVWGLWSARVWFGIEDRRAATTLWRLGWWSLVVSGGLAAAVLLQAAGVL